MCIVLYYQFLPPQTTNSHTAWACYWTGFRAKTQKILSQPNMQINDGCRWFLPWLKVGKLVTQPMNEDCRPSIVPGMRWNDLQRPKIYSVCRCNDNFNTHQYAQLSSLFSSLCLSFLSLFSKTKAGWTSQVFLVQSLMTSSFDIYIVLQRHGDIQLVSTVQYPF